MHALSPGAERREKFQVLGLWESKILNKKLDENLPKSSTGAPKGSTRASILVADVSILVADVSILVADVSILVADVSILVAETRFNALLNARGGGGTPSLMPVQNCSAAHR